MYNVDGSMRKASKSTLLHMFNLDPIPQKPLDHISLVDVEVPAVTSRAFEVPAMRYRAAEVPAMTSRATEVPAVTSRAV